MGSLPRSLAVTAATVVLYLGCLELGVRHVVDDGMRYDLEMWKYARQLKRVSTDPRIGHEHRPGTSARLMGVDVSINATGQRDRELTHPKPQGTVRILMLGDSLTFGWGVPARHTVARRLESLLNAGDGPVHHEVVNAGVGNYNAAMSAAWMRRRGVALEPDLVIFNWSFNDAEPTPRRDGGGLAEWSYAYVYFAGRYREVARRWLGGPDWRTYYAGLYADDAPGWQAARRELRALAAFCRERNLPLVLVNYPELHRLAPYPLAGVSRRVRSLARELELPYLDLLGPLRTADPEDLWVAPGDPHPNARATALMAGAIHDFLQGREALVAMGPGGGS